MNYFYSINIINFYLIYIKDSIILVKIISYIYKFIALLIIIKDLLNINIISLFLFKL